MKNTTFCYKTHAEKSAKIRALLRQRCRNTLSEEQLQRIAAIVRLQRQYAVKLHTEAESLCSALVLVESTGAEDMGMVAFGDAIFGCASDMDYWPGRLLRDDEPACAIVTRKRFDERHVLYGNELHIYIPQPLYEKGYSTQYGQKQETAYRL